MKFAATPCCHNAILLLLLAGVHRASLASVRPNQDDRPGAGVRTQNVNRGPFLQQSFGTKPKVVLEVSGKLPKGKVTAGKFVGSEPNIENEGRMLFGFLNSTVNVTEGKWII